MEQQPHKQPAATNAAASSFPAASSGSSSSSSSRSIYGGSMSSAILGLPSSSTRSQSQRRSASLYPPPLPPGHLAASRGFAASRRGSAAASGSSTSSNQLFNRQISHSPVAGPVRRRPHPRSTIQQRTLSVTSPFLSELSSIPRMATNTNLYGDGDRNAQEMPMLHAQQQEQEMTMSHSQQHTPTATPSQEFAAGGLFQSASQQQQAPQPSSFSNLQPLPGGIFSGFPVPASPSQPSSSGSGFEWPSSASQQGLNTNELAPMTSGIHYFQSSSSFSSDLASGSGSSSSSDAMYGYGHLQPSSESELPPLPPSLQIPPQYDLPPLGLGHLTQNNGPSTESTGFMQPPSNSETHEYELPPLPESLQIPPLLLHQVKQEPVGGGPCIIEPQQIISLDDDDVLSDALVQSFASESHHMLRPTNIEHSLQMGGASGGGGLAAEGGGQPQRPWEAMPTPARSMQDAAVNNGGGSTSTTSGIPWNCHGSIMPMYSLSEQQAMGQLSDLIYLWSSTESSSSMGSRVDQDLSNKFDMMNIGGSGTERPSNFSSSSATPAAAVPKLILGGMNKPGLPPRWPALGPGTSSSSLWPRRGTKEHFFSEAEMETINKDNRLKELIKMEPRRVKKILNNRVYAARLKVQEANHLKYLQSRADALKMECMSLSTQVQLHQEMLTNLKAENREMQIKLKGLNEQDQLKKALNNQLKSEIQRLKLLEPKANGLQHPNSLEMEGGSGSFANGLHQLQTQEHTPQLQLEQQPHQAVDDELMGQPQYPWKF